MKDYAYPMLMAHQKLKDAHEDGLKKDYLEAATKIADAVVWLRQAREAFVEHDEADRLWDVNVQK